LYSIQNKLIMSLSVYREKSSDVSFVFQPQIQKIKKIVLYKYCNYINYKSFNVLLKSLLFQFLNCDQEEERQKKVKEVVIRR